MVSKGTLERLLTVAQWLPLALLLAFPPHPLLQTVLLSVLSLSMLVEFRRISSHTRAFLSDSLNVDKPWNTDFAATPAFEATVLAPPPLMTPLPGPANGDSSSSVSAGASGRSLRSLSKLPAAEATELPEKPVKKEPQKERALPSMRRFSLWGLLMRLLEAIPTGQPPRDEMPDVVLLVAGTLVPLVPAIFPIGDQRVPVVLFSYHTISIFSIMFAHVMVVAPKRDPEDDPRGFFESKILELGARVLGYVWVAQGIGGAASMCRMSRHGGGRLVATALTTALGDTFGYFVGRAFGRTKAVPGLFPNKTLEGLIGHILLAPSGLIIAILLAPMLGSWTSAWMPSRTREYWYVLLIFGWTIGAVGAIGDLVESFIKRAAGVKDSGDLFRGHGGLLDRLDSHILTFQISYLLLFVLDNF